MAAPNFQSSAAPQPIAETVPLLDRVFPPEFCTFDPDRRIDLERPYGHWSHTP